jgi:SAM-dependent methyltransferase
VTRTDTTDRGGDAWVKALEAKTAAHYNSHPYDYAYSTDPAVIRDYQYPPLREFIDKYVTRGLRVAEIGCGPGRATSYLVLTGADIVAVDISQRSIDLARARCPQATFVTASNLSLPLDSGGFDVVISDGVLHCTPDPRTGFAEDARITRAGGIFYLAVYNPDGYYRFMYQEVGSVFRRIEKNIFGKVFLFLTAVPAYWVLHLIKSRGKRTWNGAVNLFYDYFITPHASFHSHAEVCEWARQENLDLVNYDSSRGNVHAFIFKKPAS